MSEFGEKLDKYTKNIVEESGSPFVITFALDPSSMRAEMSYFGINVSINKRLKKAAFDALQGVYMTWIDDCFEEIKTMIRFNRLLDNKIDGFRGTVYKYPCLSESPRKDHIMEKWKNYIKKALQPMRPYVPGEDLTDISVWDGDEPEEGGMIAVNPADEKDQWYVSKTFFRENYIEAEKA